MRAIFHVHSKYSFDSYNSAEKIIKFCERNDINFLFVTDHGTIKGSKFIKDYANKKNSSVKVILGAEYKTDIGDLIGIFLKKEIKNNEILKVLEEIKSQNGIVILPHPFCNHNLKNLNKYYKKIDFIEVFNARCSKEKNIVAEKLVKKYNFKKIYGSDAHLFSELKNVIIEFDSLEDFKKGKINLISKNYTTKYKKYFSQIIKNIKMRNFFLFGVYLIKTIYYFLRRE